MDADNHFHETGCILRSVINASWQCSVMNSTNRDQSVLESRKMMLRFRLIEWRAIYNIHLHSDAQKTILKGRSN